jgi:hypothetical protein
MLVILFLAYVLLVSQFPITFNLFFFISKGATRSRLWLQLHADISGRTFLINENTDGPLLGCAILASLGCGIHESVVIAVQNMVRVKTRIEPNEKAKTAYDRLYQDVYLKVRPSVTNIFHALAEVRGGDTFIHGEDIDRKVVGISLNHQHDICTCLLDADESQVANNKQQEKVTISPSILAADW